MRVIKPSLFYTIALGKSDRVFCGRVLQIIRGVTDEKRRQDVSSFELNVTEYCYLTVEEYYGVSLYPPDEVIIHEVWLHEIRGKVLCTNIVELLMLVAQPVMFSNVQLNKIIFFPSYSI